MQPDCNLPSGESFVRQALYGQRYFLEKFGRAATVGYNVDSFGHHAMLPALLRGAGLDSYVFMRPQEHEMGLPGRLFHWEGADGSRVLAFRIPYAYTSRDSLPTHVERCAAELQPPLLESMCFYGVGNHGGGPTKESLQWIREHQGRAEDDPALSRLLFSSPDQYFAAIREQDPPLPTVHGEFNTTPAAATPPTPASSSGTAERRACSPAPRSGRPSRMSWPACRIRTTS